MASTPVPLWIYDGAGQPLLGAAAAIFAFIDKGGSARLPQPPLGVEEVGEGQYQVNPSDDDERVGTICVVDCGPLAGVRYQAVAICKSTNRFFAALAFDQSYQLGAGAPSVSSWRGLVSKAARTAPPVVAVTGFAYLSTVTPTADDLVEGIQFRLDGAAGTLPAFVNGVFDAADYPVDPAATSIGELVRATLAADPTVASLVSTKMFPNFAPQGTIAPFIVYQVVSDIPQNAFDGDSSNRLVNARVQIDCYGRRYLEAKQVAAAVDLALTSVSSVTLAIWRTISRDLYDDEAQLHRDSADFSVWRS